MRIIRVFPRKTKATPIDDLAVVGDPRWFDEADEVHISVTFSWDLPETERLEKQWRHVAPTKIGGPATGMRGEEFTPGQYLKPGYVITSRGCPNRCWFCSVHKREGDLRELPIRSGWNVLDDNLLACSDDHFFNVITMLMSQKPPVEFTGGLEAAKLSVWKTKAIRSTKPKQIFFAYDTPDDFEPLRQAAAILWQEGFVPAPRSHVVRCYVLIGYPGDTQEQAESRLNRVLSLGILPMAMLYRDESWEKSSKEWRNFQRLWARPQIIATKGD